MLSFKLIFQLHKLKYFRKEKKNEEKCGKRILPQAINRLKLKKGFKLFEIYI